MGVKRGRCGACPTPIAKTRDWHDIARRRGVRLRWCGLEPSCHRERIHDQCAIRSFWSKNLAPVMAERSRVSTEEIHP